MVVHRYYKAIIAFHLKMDMLQRRITTERYAAKACRKHIRDDVALSAPSQEHATDDVGIPLEIHCRRLAKSWRVYEYLLVPHQIDKCADHALCTVDEERAVRENGGRE